MPIGGQLDGVEILLMAHEIVVHGRLQTLGKTAIKMRYSRSLGVRVRE